jgi:hypothetical protein
VGALVLSPAAAQEKLGQVNTQVTTLDTEIKLNVQRPDFLKAWGEFRDNWRMFYDDHQSTLKILLTGTGTVDRKSNEYQAQLTSWYTALKTENPNARLVFPAPLPPTAPPEGPSVPWWGISLITLVGTGALAYLSYASYLYAREAQAKRRFIEDQIVPAVLEARAPALSGFYRSHKGLKEAHPDSMTRMHVAKASGQTSRDRGSEVLGDGQIDWNWSPSRHMAEQDPAYGETSHDYDD